MTTGEPESTGASDTLVFEQKPRKLTWIVFAAGAMFLILVFIASINTASPNPAIILASMVLGGFFVSFTITTFRTRDDWNRFFGDRVEILKRGELMQVLPYAQVRNVAYGFRAGNDHLLTFSGEGEQPRIVVGCIVNRKKTAPTELNYEKFLSLRDALYAVVSARMVSEASQADGAAWFDEFRLTRVGLLAGDTLLPWTEVNIDANQSNGRVAVQSNGRIWGRTSMIENNVVAGLIAIRRLRSL